MALKSAKKARSAEGSPPGGGPSVSELRHGADAPLPHATAGRHDVEATIGVERRSRTWLRRALAGALILGVGVGGVAAWQKLTKPTPTAYVFARIEKGDLRVSVVTNGTVQPLGKVDVGPQISGRIARVHADYNDRVKAGQVLVELDTTQLHARVKEARARLVASRASLRDARVAEAEAKQNLIRTEALVKEGLAPKQELDTRRATHDRTQAAIDSASAQVSLSEATLTAADTDVEWATIRAPISGVILERAAEPGQVVAAAFQPPVLFVIAEDLRHMELEIDIDEADVGRVRVGQTASFSVDAYPGRLFAARVESVRNSPRTVQNVVTYRGILSVDNRDGVLKPGMTANVTITADEQRGVLLVPNAALRFTPPSVQEAPNERREQRVWLRDGDGVKRSIVELGPTDGQKSVLRKTTLAVGTEVIVDVVGPKRSP